MLGAKAPALFARPLLGKCTRRAGSRHRRCGDGPTASVLQGRLAPAGCRPRACSSKNSGAASATLAAWFVQGDVEHWPYLADTSSGGTGAGGTACVSASTSAAASTSAGAEQWGRPQCTGSSCLSVKGVVQRTNTVQARNGRQRRENVAAVELGSRGLGGFSSQPGLDNGDDRLVNRAARRSEWHAAARPASATPPGASKG